MKNPLIACACGCGRKLRRFCRWGRERRFISGHNGRAWTPEQEQRLRELYPDMKTEKLAALFGRPLRKVYAKAHRLGLRKSAAFLASPEAYRLRRGDHIGKAFWFKKGHVPANKGLRRPGWSAGRMRETQFKPGQRGSKWMPIGSRRLIDGYDYTKVRDVRSTKSGPGFVPYTVNWKPTHHLLWVKRHGRIPRDHVLIFKNGDRTDIRLRNLKLVHRRELMRRNSVHRLPKVLKQAVMQRAALVREINRRSA